MGKLELVENIKRRSIFSEVRRRYGKIICESKEDKGEIEKVLKKVPGIENFSFGLECELDFEKIKKCVLKIIEGKKFESFKINSKRTYKKFNMTSQELNEKIGEIIYNSGKKVKMKNPDLEIFIEIGESGVQVYTEKIKGVGGLPVGVSAKVVCSLSGGIDSPVAAYMIMTRGCEPFFVHFWNKEVGGEEVLEKIKKLVGKIKEFGGRGKLIVVPFDDLQKEIIKKTPSEDRMILYRRYMMKILNRIAEKEKAKGIVTGDNVGQVASQTLENLNLIHGVAEKTVLSPLIGFSKQKIIEVAKQIGTYDISIEKGEDCCSFMISSSPSTKGSLRKIEGYEGEISQEEIEKAISQRIEKI
jgi:tRNA uracil 4-sulfurtransferase